MCASLGAIPTPINIEILIFYTALVINEHDQQEIMAYIKVQI